MSPIADFVTLYKKDCKLLPKNDGQTPSGILEWDIPSSAYYYQDRGPLCLVSLADVAVQTDTGVTSQNISINIEGALTGGLANQGYGASGTNAIVNNNVGCLGIGRLFDGGAGGSEENNIYHFANGGAEPIKLLFPARPNKIRIYLYEGNKNEFSFVGNNNQDAIFVLRFDYLDPIVENEKNNAVSCKPFSF